MYYNCVHYNKFVEWNKSRTEERSAVHLKLRIVLHIFCGWLLLKMPLCDLFSRNSIHLNPPATITEITVISIQCSLSVSCYLLLHISLCVLANYNFYFPVYITSTHLLKSIWMKSETKWNETNAIAQHEKPLMCT